MRKIKRKKNVKKRKKSARGVTQRLEEIYKLMQTGRSNEAENACLELQKSCPENAKVYTLLASIALAKGDNEKTKHFAQEAVALDPFDEINFACLGAAQHNLRNYDEAIKNYSAALKINNDNPMTHYNLGLVFQDIDNFPAASKEYEIAVQLKPDYLKALNNLGRVYSVLAMGSKTIECYEKAIKLNPYEPTVYINLGDEYLTMGELKMAEDCYQKSLQIQPEAQRALYGLARIFIKTKQLDKANDIIAPLWEKNKSESDANLSLLYSTICIDRGMEDKATEILLNTLGNLEVKKDSSSGRLLHFALGKLYDQVKMYDKAFEHYSKGNELRKVRLITEENLNTYKSYVDSFSTFEDISSSEVFSPLPVFIVGMPRSGTSLVEQILASHPQVYGGGELQNISFMINRLPQLLSTSIGYPDCMKLVSSEQLSVLAKEYVEMLTSMTDRENIVRITDKMPSNFQFLGFIQRLLPNATIIHCKRNPLDTCLSCYFQDFARLTPFAYDLKTLGIVYRQYEFLMSFWKDVLKIPMLEINYEDLVNNQEKLSRELVEYCGLEWNEKCLEFYKSDRIIHTASIDQVRKPIYSKSIQRWKNYERYLDPLKEGLNQIVHY